VLLPLPAFEIVTLILKKGPAGRKVEMAEEHKIFSAETVFFRASALPTSRRAVSVGPGHLHYWEHEDDESAEGTDTEHVDHTSLRRPQGFHGRRLSADHSTFQRDFISHQESNEIASPRYPATQRSPPLTPVSSISNLASAPASPVSGQSL
jgi:arrestin-related trafficking adapter 3/6